MTDASGEIPSHTGSPLAPAARPLGVPAANPAARRFHHAAHPLQQEVIMVTHFSWSYEYLMLFFAIVALAVPAIVMYLDDDEQHHLH